MSKILILIAFIFGLSTASIAKNNSRPNIIVILADDLGYSDLGCMGAEIETPKLDGLARGGILFTKFYNTSRCCPSRASLLTGQYQWDAGIGHMDHAIGNYPEYQGYLNSSSVTIAELLRDNGYRTFMSGKWHVGSNREHWPDKRGFDQFYGTPPGGGIYFYPSPFYKRDVFKNGQQVFPDSNWYSTDAFTNAAIEFIHQTENQDTPFFIYLAYIAPHFPLQAKKQDIDKYRETYKCGYEEIRKKRFERQKQLGIVSKDYPASNPVYDDWNKIENREEEVLKMATYAAMVDCMDQNIGRLMQSLKETGLYENTLILFLSDNGACPANFNKTPEVEIGTRNSNAAYGIWYNVSNTPLRYGKRKQYEGGIATPLIVHWPEGIKNGGLINHEPAHINDIMPTCLDVANVEYPQSYNTNVLDELDGSSILPIINGKKQNKKRLFYWEHEGNKAIMQNDWKLVKLHKKEWKLYNLASDPFETNNLITQFSEKARFLEEKYNQWAIEHGVKNWPVK